MASALGILPSTRWPGLWFPEGLCPEPSSLFLGAEKAVSLSQAVPLLDIYHFVPAVPCSQDSQLAPLANL